MTNRAETKEDVAFLRSYHRPPPSGEAETATAVIHWLREHIRETAQSEAFEHAFGISVWPAGCERTEVIQLAGQTARRWGWPLDWSVTAAQVEWNDAVKRAQETLERCTKAVRRIAYERAPGDQIIAAMKSSLNGQYLPEEVILEFCRRIAHATIPAHRVSRR